MTWTPGTHVDSPTAAEEMAAHHMAAVLGLGDARRTPTGPDGGVDVRSRRAIAQVKRHAALTGRPDLQRLVGARGKDASLGLLFYSAAGYSQAARGYADDMGVALFTYSIDGTVTEVNAAARRMRASGRRAAGPSSSTDGRHRTSLPRLGCSIGGFGFVTLVVIVVAHQMGLVGQWAETNWALIATGLLVAIVAVRVAVGVIARRKRTRAAVAARGQRTEVSDPVARVKGTSSDDYRALGMDASHEAEGSEPPTP